MRLSTADIATIRRTAAEIFGERAVVRLFGSRIDDRLEGGDVDLHVELPADAPPTVWNTGSDLRYRLECRLEAVAQDEEPRVDVLVHRVGERERPIDRLAKLTGVVLAPASLDLPVAQVAPEREALMKVTLDMLADGFKAAQRTASRAALTRQHLGHLFPMTEERAAALTFDDKLNIDGLIRQVESLIHTISRQVARSLIMLEDTSVIPVKEELGQRLAELGIAESDTSWKELVGLRNFLAHEYPLEPAKQADGMNKAFDAIPRLQAILDRARVVAVARHPALVPLLPPDTAPVTAPEAGAAP